MREKRKIAAYILCVAMGVSTLCTPLPKTVYADTQQHKEIVEVPDYNLRRGLLDAINRNKGIFTPITEAEIEQAVFSKDDLAEITELSPELCQAHNASENGVKITDLSGLEHCINLSRLSLVNQNVTNLEPLRNLTQLEYIDLRNNGNGENVIKDISPLENLVNLRHLNLNQSKIENSAYLSGMHKMEHLELMGTKISNIDFAANMPLLYYADLSLNNIQDIQPLENCKSLVYLYLSASPRSFWQTDSKKGIEDISALRNMRHLRELSLSNHDIQDIYPLSYLRKLEVLELQNNQINDFEAVFTLPKLERFWANNNPRSLSNQPENLAAAKHFYAKLDKAALQAEDLAVIEDLLAAEENISNHFREETLQKLREIKDILVSGKTYTEPVFAGVHRLLPGEITEVYALPDMELYAGEGMEALREKLPAKITVSIQQERWIPKEEDEEPNPPLPDPSLPEEESELGKHDNTLRFRLVDTEGNPVREAILRARDRDGMSDTLQARVEGDIHIFTDRQEDYHYDIFLDSASYRIKEGERYGFETAYPNAFVTIMQKDERKKISEVESKEDKEKYFTILVEKVSSEKEEEKPPTEDFTEKLGLQQGNLVFRVLDESGEPVARNILQARDTEGYDYPIKAQAEEGFHRFAKQDMDYTYRLQLSDNTYRIKDGKQISFISTYPEGYVRLLVNGESKVLADINTKEEKEKYFVLQLEKLEDVEGFGEEEIVLPSRDSVYAAAAAVAPEEEVLYDTREMELEVYWDLENLKDEEGTYIIYGEPVLTENIYNSLNLTAVLKLQLLKKEEILPEKPVQPTDSAKEENPIQPEENKNPTQPEKVEENKNPIQPAAPEKTKPDTSAAGTSSGNDSASSSANIKKNGYKSYLPRNYTGAGKVVDNYVIPASVLEGNWRLEKGSWYFKDQQQSEYKGKWAQIYNPYTPKTADIAPYAWYKFDENGKMLTSWYTDEKGDTYYLQPESNGTMGMMLTSWILIDGKWYYFNTQEGAELGKLLKNTKTPDGYYVTADGTWDGKNKE